MEPSYRSLDKPMLPMVWGTIAPYPGHPSQGRGSNKRRR